MHNLLMQKFPHVAEIYVQVERGHLLGLYLKVPDRHFGLKTRVHVVYSSRQRWRDLSCAATASEVMILQQCSIVCIINLLLLLA